MIISVFNTLYRKDNRKSMIICPYQYIAFNNDLLKIKLCDMSSISMVLLSEDFADIAVLDIF